MPIRVEVQLAAGASLPAIVLPATTSSLGLSDGNALMDVDNFDNPRTTTPNAVRSIAIIGTVAKEGARALIVVEDSIAWGGNGEAGTSATGDSGLDCPWAGDDAVGL